MCVQVLDIYVPASKDGSFIHFPKGLYYKVCQTSCWGDNPVKVKKQIHNLCEMDLMLLLAATIDKGDLDRSHRLPLHEFGIILHVPKCFIRQ